MRKTVKAQVGAKAGKATSGKIRSSSRPAISAPRTAYKESQIPALAASATVKAAQRARACGLSVTEVSGNQIIKLSPDGQRTVLKEIKSGVKVAVGQKIRLS